MEYQGICKSVVTYDTKKMNIFSGVVTSFKRSWKGEEKFWKVFWIWGVLLYCISLICYKPPYLTITRSTSLLFSLVQKPTFQTFVFKKAIPVFF
jgi:hypothetical protein